MAAPHQLSPTLPDVHEPHPDFLGSASQGSPYLHTSLDLHTFDSYTLTDIKLPTLTTSDATVDSSVSTDWSCSSTYPQESVLFGNASYDLSYPSPSPSTVNVGLHDSYWSPDGFHNNYTPSQPPRIHIQTELQGANGQLNMSFLHSPSHMMTPYASSTSPSASSAGSAPPATPQTPWTTISSNPSPLISQHNLSPISPSSQFTNPTVTFDQIVVKSDQSYPSEQSVLDLAARAGHPLGGILVPQKTYRPHTMSDRRRYVEDVHLDVPIMFYTHNPFGCGISLKDALSSKFSSLEGRDDSMFAGRGPSVSIRLNWPGYAPWSRQIPTRDFRSPPHPITRAKLARNVAKTINRFIMEMESQNQEDVNEARWRVGTRGIRLEDLALVGLEHVSMGSWQAHVRMIGGRR